MRKMLVVRMRIGKIHVVFIQVQRAAEHVHDDAALLTACILADPPIMHPGFPTLDNLSQDPPMGKVHVKKKQKNHQ